MGKALTHGTFQLHPISLYKELHTQNRLQEAQEPKWRWIDWTVGWRSQLFRRRETMRVFLVVCCGGDCDVNMTMKSSRFHEKVNICRCICPSSFPVLTVHRAPCSLTKRSTHSPVTMLKGQICLNCPRGNRIIIKKTIAWKCPVKFKNNFAQMMRKSLRTSLQNERVGSDSLYQAQCGARSQGLDFWALCVPNNRLPSSTGNSGSPDSERQRQPSLSWGSAITVALLISHGGATPSHFSPRGWRDNQRR